ncbi:MAG: hypothetical protein JSW39_14845, partial [Desulfobacterales bacterium]
LTAVRENATATITFDAGDASYSASVGGDTFKRGTMPGGISITSVTFGFNNQGIPTATGNVTLSNGSANRVIEVRPGGNARIL